MNILSYQIEEKLHDGRHSIVFRGHGHQEKQKIILKILKKDYPTPEEVARFKREYEITRDLCQKASGVIKIHDIEKYQNSLVMILEDFGGESLTRLKQQMKLDQDLGEFLRLAIKITGILDEIHRQQVIHKDINPTNIIWNSRSRQLKLIDFCISTVLPCEIVEHTYPGALEGTLPYMSPEQTGRMNRCVDYRTDFYSLGVTFYELLTSQLPFIAKDPLELMHCHLARTPSAPRQLNPDIPAVLSHIVMKLMAKNAEDRYQSALGLKQDLEKCLKLLTDTGKCQYYAIGEKDICNRFHIPSKLYGRDRETQMLLKAFERTTQGNPVMMMLAGEAGIGKTSLVRELYRPIARKRGYFISGKFVQFKLHMPYTPLIQAFQDLIRQVLSESEEQIEGWKTKILDSVGKNVRVIIEVIPELELIIGKQEPLPTLPPAQAQNRFNQAFQDLVRVFAAREHPLILYLDNLQWVDLPSLKLIELLMSEVEDAYLFFIGAYRDNEVDHWEHSDHAHPLILTINALEEKGIEVHTITLPPLGLEHVNRLTADTLACNPELTKPLAKLSWQKTKGNPLFLKHFLFTLYQQHLLHWDSKTMSWHWNTGKIETAVPNKNVVDLIKGNIRKFSPETQHVLKMAAAIGGDFNLKTLSFVVQKIYKETADHLWAALQRNFVYPLDEKYKYARIFDQSGFKSIAGQARFRFSHDIIQQAAYSLIHQSDRADIHLQMGRLMLEKIPPEKQEEKIFEIIDHLNSGLRLITQSPDIIEMVKLNLFAAKKAKSCLAYQSALVYVTTAAQLLLELPGDSWQDQYILTYQLHKEWAEIEYLNGDFLEAQSLIGLILERARTNMEKAELYGLLIVLYTLQAKYGQALEASINALQLFGIHLPYKNLEYEILHLNGKLHKRLVKRSETESQEIFARAFFSSPALMAITTIEEGRIADVNETFVQVLGYRRDELIGRTTSELELWVNPEKRNSYIEHLKGHQEIHNIEVEFRKKSGEICFTLLSGVVIPLEGEPHLLNIAIDISERKKLEEKLQTAAITDELTGLYNRRGFFALAQQQCKLADRTKRKMSLIFVDLDELKSINDQFGHQAGDEALVDTANILKSIFRKSDIIGRIGGDEFAILLTEHRDSDIESIIITNIDKNFLLHNRQGGRQYHLSASMGIAQYNPEHPCSFGDLLIKADAAMYENKRRHKYNEILLSQPEQKKRKYKRYQVRNHWSNIEGLQECHIKNISIGGLCVKTPQLLPANDVYEVEIPLVTNGGGKLKASVVWSVQVKSSPRKTEKYCETGLKFIGLSAHQKEPLKKFLRTLDN